jgi:lipopolysaccharide transport system ATP-binding protein
MNMNPTMAQIELTNVGVEFPVFNAAGKSLKNRVLSKITGGRIERKYDGHVIVHGLKNISLKISAGERVGLIGHNGSGKTTLLRILSGIYQPTSGLATIRGECVSLINIGLGIDPEATGRENILLRAAMMGITAAKIDKKIEEIIAFSGLGDFIDIPFRTYSSGMQLRLAFAVSTSIHPQILIMDEWLSTGDEEFKERAETRLKEVIDSTEILVLASHSPELLLSVCNRVIWLYQGNIRIDGLPNEVLKQYLSK